MLTLEGVMRTEFNEGLTMRAAADEASIEVVAPDRMLVLIDGDGALLAMWGQPFPREWRPDRDRPAVDTIVANGSRLAHDQQAVRTDRTAMSPPPWPRSPASKRNTRNCSALGIGGLVAVFVAIAGGWIVGRQTLQPLTRMAAQATAITERNLSERLDAPSGDELGQFAGAFNGLLDRLAGVLHSQRQFMADASHELRTPVSVVRDDGAGHARARKSHPKAITASRSRLSPSNRPGWRGWSTRCSCSRGPRRGPAAAARAALPRRPRHRMRPRLARPGRRARHRRRRVGGGRDHVLGRRHAAAPDARQPARQRHPPRQTRRTRRRDDRVGADGGHHHGRRRWRRHSRGSARAHFPAFVRLDPRSTAPAWACRSRAGSPKRTAADDTRDRSERHLLPRRPADCLGSVIVRSSHH